jgi:hypothetical protein
MHYLIRKLQEESQNLDASTKNFSFRPHYQMKRSINIPDLQDRTPYYHSIKKRQFEKARYLRGELGAHLSKLVF